MKLFTDRVEVDELRNVSDEEIERRLVEIYEQTKQIRLLTEIDRRRYEPEPEVCVDGLAERLQRLGRTRIPAPRIGSRYALHR